MATDTSGLETPSLLTYGKNFFPDLLGGTVRIFSKDNLPIFLTGSILAALAATTDHADRNTKNYFQTRHPISGVSNDGDMIGQGYYHVGVGAAFLAAGELTNNRQLADTGVVVLEALLIDGIATEGLKYSTHRHRPNNGDYMSFPSGHTSSTATLAASISAMYDWDWKVTVPMYGIVAFVGASRIQDNMHYLSDVIAGATLGTLIGTSFANYHKEKDASRGGLHVVSVSPLLDRDIKGALFTLKW